jgi:hypothetical protein
MKSWRMRLAGYGPIARTEEMRTAYKILVEKPVGMRPLGRPECSWMENIKMDLKGKGVGGSSWVRIGPVTGSCKHGNVLRTLGKSEESLEQLSDYHRLNRNSASPNCYITHKL